MRVLITAPSLDEGRNVSGISTMVREVLRRGKNDFTHFPAGSSDVETSALSWLLRQIALPFRFASEIGRIGADVVHINTSFTSRATIRDAILLFIARSHRVPAVVSIHGGEYLVDRSPGLLIHTFARYLTSASSQIVVLAENERRSVEERFGARNVTVIPNAVPVPNIPEREANTPPAILFMGRFHRDKGVYEIIDAVKILKNRGIEFGFRAYGEGPERVRFCSDMSDLLGESFIYGGVVGGSDKEAAIADSDIFILPSYHEGQPLALLEAMAAGRIVIASDLTTTSEMIDNGSNGILIEARDPVALADAIAAAMDDRKNWKAMGLNARETVGQRFEITAYVDRLEALYSKVVDK